LGDWTRRLAIHLSCFTEFGIVVRETLRSTGNAPPASGLGRLARRVEGNIILVHRRFPTEQIPILVFLAHFDKPVPVLDVYAWLRQNEVKIRNPSLALLRLSDKGLVTTLKQNGARLAMITDAGIRMVDEYASSIE